MQPQNLNILFVGTLPPHPGGSAIANALFLSGCVALGHTVRALAPITAEAQQAGAVFESRHPGIGVARYFIPSFETFPNVPASDDRRRLEGEQILEKLPALITRDRPDIIIIGRETFAWHVPRIARAHSLPSLLMIHGGMTIGLSSGAYPEAQTRELMEQFRTVDLIVTSAQHMAERLRGLGVGVIKVIPNAVDMERFAPRPKSAPLLRQLAIRDDDIVVVHASNLKSLKRPLDIVSSAEAALRRNPRLVYVIVGDGPYRQSTEDACRSSHVSERFRFVGWVDHERMPDYVNLADMVVMPSAVETQALIYLETQACARLLLASDIPGAREVVENGETGLLFRMGDIEDLVAKTLLAADDPGLRAQIGRKAREHVWAHSLRDVAAAYAATLSDVVRQHAGM